MVAVRLFLILTLLCGAVYPLLTTGIAQLVFRSQANGSRIVRNGQLIGSEWIGQHREDPKYFWPRLSATSSFPYNSAISSGTNYGPHNPKLKEKREARAKALRDADPGNTTVIPEDLLTASGSGLDPHISPAAAAFQAPRIARLRGIPLDRINGLIAQHTTGPQLGLLGEPTVNVLQLNLSLDTL
jgi:potassium-transporting ATPase KdpC subunit